VIHQAVAPDLANRFRAYHPGDLLCCLNDDTVCGWSILELSLCGCLQDATLGAGANRLLLETSGMVAIHIPGESNMNSAPRPTDDLDDDRDDEHASENEAPIRESDENTETPEEFRSNDEDGARDATPESAARSDDVDEYSDN
jgi:hypothetical protein